MANSVYLKREQALEHLRRKGFKFGGWGMRQKTDGSECEGMLYFTFDTGGKYIELTDEDYEALDILSPEEK